MTQHKGTRRQRLIGMGFVIAFVLSTATIIYTGLNVRAPGSHRGQSEAGEVPADAAPAAAVRQSAASGAVVPNSVSDSEPSGEAQRDMAARRQRAEAQ